MASKVTTLFEDSAKQNALYPRTKVSAISDNSSNSLQQLLDAKQDDLIAGSGITISGANISSYTDMDLLWTNASPSSSWTAQTISINYTDYVFLLIEANSDTSITPNAYNSQTAIIDPNRININQIIYQSYNGDSGIRWNGVLCNSDKTTLTIKGNGIPYKIYGVR